MKNDIDSKFILSVFDKIIQHGEKKGDEHFLMGIKGYTDFDGYTLFIEDALVHLNFGFHNQYHFTYEKEEDFEKFVKRLVRTDLKYSGCNHSHLSLNDTSQLTDQVQLVE